jgi:hypothetical protein
MENQLLDLTVHALAKTGTKRDRKANDQELPDFAHARDAERKRPATAETDEAINLSVSNMPQSIVLQSALEGINKALQDIPGDNMIQKVYDSGIDVGPEMTADRIVSSSLQIFPAFQAQHPELTQEEALNVFIDIIRGGMRLGFLEAKDILSNLNALVDDNNETIIDQTFMLAQKKLQLFADRLDYAKTKWA